MIRIVTSKRLRDLREKEATLERFREAQAKAEDKISSMSRKERRQAWRDLWSELPE